MGVQAEGKIGERFCRCWGQPSGGADNDHNLFDLFCLKCAEGEALRPETARYFLHKSLFYLLNEPAALLRERLPTMCMLATISIKIEASTMTKTLLQNGAFFAFPSRPKGIQETIEGGLKIYAQASPAFQVFPWTELDISGNLIWQKVLSSIDERGLLISDVSILNPNVTYEIGYAIGKGKKLRFVLNKNFTDSEDRDRLGIFDVIGYTPYETASDLSMFLHESLPQSESMYVDQDLDLKAPIFLFDAFEKSELVNHIKTCVKKRLVKFRSFDPQEQARLPVHEAIREVAISEGIVTSIIPKKYPESNLHNLRSAFVAGLAHGMNKLTTIIQLGDDATPMDFREFTVECYSKEHIENAIDKFALEVMPRIQSTVHSSAATGRSILEKVDLGGSVAENEIQTIDEYYHDTDAFLRTLQGEVKLIIGRKGSGKSALFLRVRNEKRSKKRNVIVDLKPEGYKLLKFKERIVDALSEGSLQHVVSGIWEYVLLLELAYKVLEKDRNLYTRDQRLVKKYEKLCETYEQDEYYSDGDFSERVSVLLDDIGEKIDRERSGQSRAILSQKQVTELIYKHPINSLRGDLIDYLKEKDDTWILVDNLDKGWPSAGVSKGDVVLISCLLEALEKIARSFRRSGYDRFFSTVFLRGDVYENLVDKTADRGKITPVSVDWSDPSALKELLRKRFIFSEFDSSLDIDDIWQRIAVPKINERNSLDVLIERALYRPRALVDLIYSCKSFAVNRRHSRIESDDFVEASRAFSIQLIDNVSLELRDISPKFENLLYEFVDREPTFSRATLRKIIKNFVKDESPDENEQQITDLLLWFGFLGVTDGNRAATYIFDVAYNMNMLSAISKKPGSSVHFSIHSAFRPGLQISDPTVHPQIRLL